MISGETRGAGGPALVRHLESFKDGQRVQQVAGRHVSATSLAGQLREIALGARRNKTTRPILHIHVDPPIEHQSASVFRKWIAEFEREFNLQQAPRAGVFHVGKGGANRRHLHLCYGLVRPDGRLVDLKNSYRRREKVSVIVAASLGLPPPPVPRPRSILAALIQEGREDAVQWMRTAYPQLADGPRVAATSPTQRHISERTGTSRDDMLAVIADAWLAPSALEFQRRLAAAGFTLAKGDQVPVVLDPTKTAYPLARTIRSACRSHNIPPPPAAVVYSRVADFQLLNIQQVRKISPMAKTAKNRKGASSGQDIVNAFGDRVRLVRRGPPHRILTRDGGWVVVNQSSKTLQVSGKLGDADDLANQLAALESYSVRRVIRRRAKRKPVVLCAALSQEDEASPSSRFQWWVSRGHTPEWQADGIAITVNGTMLVDRGSKIEVHSLPPSAEALDEIARFAVVNWKGALRLDVPTGSKDWNAADKERLWLACQRNNVRYVGYSPSPSLLRRWELEQGEGAQGSVASLMPSSVDDEIALPEAVARSRNQELDKAIDRIKGQWGLHARDPDRIEIMRSEIARLEALKDGAALDLDVQAVEGPPQGPRL